MNKNKTIAVLLTCHNRREKTLKCLEMFYENSIPKGYILDVFLVDDGSIDGTGDGVLLNFPDVKVIQGDGNLFWNKGMRLAWETAAQCKKYDFYLWLNDDTLLDKNALTELLECYDESLKYKGKESLIVGSCRDEFNSNTFSYGGRIIDIPVIPNGSIQNCNYINGNLVLVPKIIYDTIGNLSHLYTHAIGDNDYGLRALNAGFGCFISRKYIATCPTNKMADWCNPKIHIKKRFLNLYSPKGLNINEYIIFLKKHHKRKWIISVVKVYLNTLLPRIYRLLSEKSMIKTI